MEKSEKYDVITQSIEIPIEVSKQAHYSGDALNVRAYVMSELARQMAEKLIRAGYITETWIKKDDSEECILTLYVKPLIKKN